MKRTFYFFIIVFLTCSWILFIIEYNLIKNKFDFNKKNYGKKKYIQFECSNEELCGGWADRLKGLMATYAFSLITNRTFLIKMTKPCDLRKILEPNEIDWNYLQVPENMRTKFKLLDFGWNFSLVEKFRNQWFIPYRSSDEGMVVIKSGFMFSDPLSENPNLKYSISQLGFEPSKFKIVYQLNNWYSKLFKLNKRLKSKYDQYLKYINRLNDSKLICAQIRMGDLNHKAQMSPDTGKHFWKFINDTFMNASDSYKYKLFITSDREHIKIEAKQYFLNNEVFYNRKSSVHIDKKIEQNECENMENVLFDFHLMKNCDIGVVSHSGFGILAMWNRPDPFKDVYIYTKKDQNSIKKNYWDRSNLTFIKYSNLNDIYFT